MTSLFEAIGPWDEMPVDLVSRGRRGVELLEFMAVGARDMEDAAAAAEADVAGEAMRGETLQAAERAAQMRAMLDAAREDAAAETRSLVELEFEERMRLEKHRVERLLREFVEQRQTYFAQAEVAVVRLALSVASKVLQREVAADAMHLAATVRAALSRIQDGSVAVMRVRPEEVEGWLSVFAEECAGKVEIVGDKAIRPGDLILETTIGRVELGVAAQLGEIERGFRELLERGEG
jgi:flagellar assembly protein FliH